MQAAPPLLVIDARFHVMRASQLFFQTFQLKPEETIGRSVYDLGDGEWNIAQLRTLLSGLSPENTRTRDFEIVHGFELIGQRRLLIDACRVLGKDNLEAVIVLSIQDITETGRSLSQGG